MFIDIGTIFDPESWKIFWDYFWGTVNFLKEHILLDILIGALSIILGNLIYNLKKRNG